MLWAWATAICGECGGGGGGDPYVVASETWSLLLPVEPNEVPVRIAPVPGAGGGLPFEIMSISNPLGGGGLPLGGGSLPLPPPTKPFGGLPPNGGWPGVWPM